LCFACSKGKALTLSTSLAIDSRERNDGLDIQNEFVALQRGRQAISNVVLDVWLRRHRNQSSGSSIYSGILCRSD
jgi:hypothetical protein